MANFEICLDANALTGLTAKAAITNYANTGNANTIDTFVLLKGNGSASAGNQYILFGPDATKAGNVQHTISNSRIVPETNTLADVSFSEASALTGNVNQLWPYTGAITRASAATGTATSFKHYALGSDAAHGLAKTYYDDDDYAAGEAFKVDGSKFSANQCGANNANVVQAVVYLDLTDILASPADTYNGGVTFTFEYA